MEFQGKDEGRPLIGWCLELNFTEVLIGPRWVKSDPLGGPNSNVHSTPYQETLLDYENIMKIANNATSIPPISPNDSTRLLYSLKADVNDFYSITANHFIHAGFEGLEYFNFLLNIIIEEINFSSLGMYPLQRAWEEQGVR